MNRRTTRTLVAVAVATMFAFVFVQDVQGSPKRGGKSSTRHTTIYRGGLNRGGIQWGGSLEDREAYIIFAILGILCVCISVWYIYKYCNSGEDCLDSRTG